ncbi:MAG: MMPL family transporter [Deltaproteobacteria bacterium]|nr:MMPL family transporter [Deltaproteobacteria bacterium]
MVEEKKTTIGVFIVRYRYLIMAVMGLLTVLFLYGMTQKLSMQILLEEMIPPNHEFVKLHGKYESVYGGTSTVMLAIVMENGDIFKPEILKKIKRINDKLLFNEDIRRSFVYSIAQRKSKATKGHSGGTVDVSALMWPEIDTSPEGIEKLKRNIFTGDLYNGVLVSKDGKATLIMADCWDNIDYSKFFNFIQGIKELEEDENLTIHVAGRPMLLGWIYHFMPKLYVIFAITIAFIVIVVTAYFCNVVVIIPLMALVMSTVWGFGVISLFGVNFNPLMVVLAVLVAARALSHSVQTTRRYLEELWLAKGDRVRAAEKTLDGLFLASLAAIVTDAAGFSVLILARIPMIQKIAILCACWVVSILLISSILGPLLCMYMPVPKNLKKYDFSWDKDKKKKKRGLMDIAADMCLKRSNIAIVVGMIVIGMIAATFDSKLKVGDTFPGSPILWPDSRYNMDCKKINEKFDASGTDLISVIVEGEEEWSIQDPEVIKRIDLYERYITHKFPDLVGGTQSVARIIKTMNKEFHEGDVRYMNIPDDKRLITNLMFFYQTSGDPGDYTTLFDGRCRHTIIRVFLKDHRGETLANVVQATKDFFESQPAIKGIEFKCAAGYGGILAATNEEIKKSQTGTLLLVFMTVFIFCGLAYRSVVAAILLCVPLLVASLVAFMYMVIKDLGLDINVLPVAAVGIGIGVDYGIYMLSRMEEEFKNTGGDWNAATHTTMNSAGKGVVITAITVVIPILLWPIMADLKFQAEMGLLLSFIMIFDMLGALLFLPAAVNLIKPKFMLRSIGATITEDTSICDLVQRGDAAAVEHVINNGGDVRAICTSGSWPIIEALRNVDGKSGVRIIELLLNAGADPNVKDNDGRTALQLAAHSGFDEAVSLLCGKGASQDAGSPLKERPIGIAIRNGHIKTIAALIDAGAKIDAEEILYAVDSDSSDGYISAEMILRLFVNKKVNLNIENVEKLRGIEKIRATGSYAETVAILKSVCARNS